MSQDDRRLFYLLLARLLSAPPDEEMQCVLAQIENVHLSALSQQLKSFSQTQLEEEFHRLFIGITRGEVMPYASWYLTGLLNAEPLAKLRQELRRLGLARQEGILEPEDHLAFLYEVMALLVEEGRAPEERCFFKTHLAPWSHRFWQDLATASSARFYREVAAVGKWFDGEERRLSLL